MSEAPEQTFPRRTGDQTRYGGEPWESWQTGLGTYEQRTLDGRCLMRANYGLVTFCAWLDGDPICSHRTGKPQRFRSRYDAALTCLTRRKAKDALAAPTPPARAPTPPPGS